MTEITNQLLVTLGVDSVAVFTLLIGASFVLFQNWKRDLNQLFFFLCASVSAYLVFFFIASVQTDYDAAYFWWLFNICDVFIPMAAAHFIFRVINLQVKWRWYLIGTYVSGLAILAAALLEPHSFVPFVSAKIYFPYYLNAGPVYIAMLVYFFVVPIIPFLSLVAVYFQSGGMERKRYEYFILMLIVGYLIGPLNFLLVFNVPVDPIFGMFIFLYLIPVAYGIFSSQLLDIRLVIKRAFYYAVGIGAVAAFLSALVLLNDFLVSAIPWLQVWSIPLGVSVVAFVIGRLVWMQAKETDKLKYEFITVAAHKLRTPLTRIRWIIPLLIQEAGANEKLKEGITQIDIANNRLIELTNVLLEAAHTEDTGRWYKRAPVDLSELAHKALDRFKAQVDEKKLAVSVHADQSLPQVSGDPERLASVVEIFIENAVVYTPANGSVKVDVEKKGNGVRFSVTDTGIGVSPEDRERIFSSFFRTDAAKVTDTEGVGLGLSVAKSIVERHGGKIGMESAGAGKGSTFWFTLRA